MKDLFLILAELDKDEHIHLGRLLLLLKAFSGDSGLGEIEGLTKLAKLDFLLRYPVYLERALIAYHDRPMRKAPPRDFERRSVETRMIRFRYGPWDFRYRRFINTLIGMGLVYIRNEGKSSYVGITEAGISIANKISINESFSDMVERAKIIKMNFNISGTHLMRFIYKTFPEISSLQFGKEI